VKRVWIVYNKAGDSVYSGSDIIKAGAAADSAVGSMVVSFMVEDSERLPNKIRRTVAGDVELSTEPVKRKSSEK